MTPVRPDLVDVWVYRVTRSARNVEQPEILLMRRSPGRFLAGLWQGVSGSLEKGERVTAGALRELVEETGFDATTIEAFYDLDLVNTFYEPAADAVVSSAVFAVRVGPSSEPQLSAEHDDAAWRAIDDAYDEVIWPGYRTAIERIRHDLADPARAPWFELTLAGDRAPRSV